MRNRQENQRQKSYLTPEKNKSTVAIVLPDLSIIGAQRVAIDYGKKLTEIGFDVTWIAGTSGQFSREVNSSVVKIFGAKFTKKIRVIRFLEGIVNLAILLVKGDYAVIYSVAPLMNRMLCFFKMIKLLKSHLLIEDHAYPPRSYKDEFKNQFVRSFYRRSEFLYNFADSFRVLSNESKEYYDASMRRKIAKMMPNLMDLERIENLAALDNKLASPSKPRLVYVGRFTSQKNIGFIIKSFEVLIKKIDCELIIIGYGNEKGYLQNIVNSLEVHKDIIFLDSSDDNYSILKSANLFPIASIWEGMPLVIIEAMLLGVPVVCTDFKAGPRYLLGELSERGWIVPENDIFAFADAMEHVINNKQNAQEKACLANEFVKHELDINKNFEKYINLFFPALTNATKVCNRH